jgi:hypothetical protein
MVALKYMEGKKRCPCIPINGNYNLVSLKYWKKIVSFQLSRATKMINYLRILILKNISNSCSFPSPLFNCISFSHSSPEYLTKTAVVHNLLPIYSD